MGNTVGSLSEVQKQVILGCILGDGYMRVKTNAHLQITHSIKQKEYVDWKHQILRDLVLTPPKQYSGNAGRIGYRFFTRSLPAITQYYKMFYENGCKVIPKGLVLSPLSLAVWFMDDGAKSRKSIYLNTQNFDSSSQNNLIGALGGLGIIANLHKDKQYFRIHIPKQYAAKMVHIIKPFVIASMQYKLLI